MRLILSPASIARSRVVIHSWAEVWWLSATVILFSLLLMRGGFELILPKKMAMVLQLGGVVSLSTFLFYRSRLFYTRWHLLSLVIALCFMLDGLASGGLTSLLRNFHIWGVYLIFTGIIMWIALLASRPHSDGLKRMPIAQILCFYGWILFLVALCEQLKLIKLPGESILFIVRPASLTGSFLHYPIVISLLSFIQLQWYSITGSRLYKYSGVIFAMGAIIVASRSAIFIIFGATILYAVLSFFKGRPRPIFFWTLGFLLFIVIGLLVEVKEDEGSIAMQLLDRVLHAGNVQSAGNSGRIYSWMITIHDWWDTNLYIGERAGMVTNSTGNVGKIAESSVLQQLANFGLIGLTLYYLFLFRVYSFISKDHLLLRAVFLAALGQTCFYQSIEVIPFIVLLILMPWISQSFEYAQRHR
jgi:hypothetical protein